MHGFAWKVHFDLLQILYIFYKINCKRILHFPVGLGQKKDRMNMTHSSAFQNTTTLTMYVRTIVCTDRPVGHPPGFETEGPGNGLKSFSAASLFRIIVRNFHTLIKLHVGIVCQSLARFSLFCFGGTGGRRYNWLLTESVYLQKSFHQPTEMNLRDCWTFATKTVVAVVVVVCEVHASLCSTYVHTTITITIHVESRVALFYFDSLLTASSSLRLSVAKVCNGKVNLWCWGSLKNLKTNTHRFSRNSVFGFHSPTKKQAWEFTTSNRNHN